MFISEPQPIFALAKIVYKHINGYYFSTTISLQRVVGFLLLN